ncbi:MAG TPA: hypothetical protein VMW50_07360 [Dehalococcoidia bacterium]|nr:hypothetical protein [Dehalococcoidia bacterium]
MPRSRKSQRAKRRAKQEEKIYWGVLPARREDGTPDVTPHIASWNLTTEGGYLELGEGFIIIENDERDSYIDKVREYQEVGGENWHGGIS